jgi:hypothetical protein
MPILERIARWGIAHQKSSRLTATIRRPAAISPYPNAATGQAVNPPERAQRVYSLAVCTQRRRVPVIGDQLYGEPVEGQRCLQRCGYQVIFLPDVHEELEGAAFNIVTLGPRTVLMAQGNPTTQAFYEQQGITCHTVLVDELAKAAGAVGCLTSVIERDRV